jgi:flagellar hook-length control protein FliK
LHIKQRISGGLPVPYVASETTTHAFRPSLHNPARAGYASERAQGSPFESLLDDSTQTAAQQPAHSQPASGDHTAPAAQSDATRPPAKAKHDKPAKTSDTAPSTDADNAAATGTTDNDGNATSDAVAAANATISTVVTAGADSKPASDGEKPASDATLTDGVTPADVAAAIPANPIQTNTPADAAVLAVAVAPVTAPAPVPVPVPVNATAPASEAAPVSAPAPAPANAPVTAPVPEAAPAPAADPVPQAAPVADLQTAPAAADHPEIVTAALLNARPVHPAALRTTFGRPADDEKSPANAAPELPDDGRPQPATTDTGRETVTHARDDVPANTHHSVSAEALPTINADVTAATPHAPGDIAQPIALTAPAHNAATASPDAATAPAAQPVAQPAAIPLVGVAIEIAAKAIEGKNRFEIRLDPPELGRIEVRLDVDHDGNVTSRLIADRSDTLDLLRRDASGLERALQDAGLKTSDNGLQFALRDHSMGREQSHTPTPGAAQLVVSDETLAASDATQRHYGRLAGLRGGIDIRV